ncbi:hypothetical protein FRC02_000204 [Tulasnella sp. 418]|nr:hypothetical protein FRC02_000204 [Tulasnella sp. 418]
MYAFVMQDYLHDIVVQADLLGLGLKTIKEEEPNPAKKAGEGTGKYSDSAWPRGPDKQQPAAGSNVVAVHWQLPIAGERKHEGASPHQAHYARTIEDE